MDTVEHGTDNYKRQIKMALWRDYVFRANQVVCSFKGLPPRDFPDNLAELSFEAVVQDFYSNCVKLNMDFMLGGLSVPQMHFMGTGSGNPKGAWCWKRHIPLDGLSPCP